MKENSIRRAVREGRAALGTGLKEFAARGVPRIIEASGFDYCMIDMEHGAFGIETIADLAAWFAATDISPIVRIHKAFVHYIPLMLDQGIMGIQISGVETAEEARDIVREAKYPPLGTGGCPGWARTPATGAFGTRYRPNTSLGEREHHPLPLYRVARRIEERRRDRRGRRHRHDRLRALGSECRAGHPSAARPPALQGNREASSIRAGSMASSPAARRRPRRRSRNTGSWAARS